MSLRLTLQLKFDQGHTNQRTRRLAAEVTKSRRAHFNSAVLHCLELNRIQIEGELHVRYPGYYRIEWRFMLQAYALLSPTFSSRVLGPKQLLPSDSVYQQKFSFDIDEPITESFYKWTWDAGETEPQRGADQALPVGDFFEVIVGKVHVGERDSKVLVSMVEGFVCRFDCVRLRVSRAGIESQ